MKSTIEEVGPCKRKLVITVDAERVDEEIAKSYAELRNTVAIPGFRKGKTPRGILEKRFGKHILQDVKHDLIRDGIQKTIEENELEVVSSPEVSSDDIELVRGNAMSFEATVEVKPAFDMPGYKGLEVTRVLGEVTDDEVDSVIQRMRHERAAWIPVEDEPARDHDHVIGQLVLTAGGKEVFNREDASTILADDDSIVGVPFGDAQDEFLGCELDKTISWQAELPDDHYIKDLQGLSVDATFTVTEIKRMDVPEADDELAGAFKCESMDELREKIKEDLGQHKKGEAEHQVQEALIDQLVAASDFPLPETVVNDVCMSRIRNEIIQRMMRGEAQESDIEGLRDQLMDEVRPEAEKQVRAWYMIEEIAKKEKIFATEDDIHEQIRQMAMQRGQTPTQILEEIVKNERMGDLRASVLEQKVRKFLTDNAEIVDDSSGNTSGSAAEEGGEEN